MLRQALILTSHRDYAHAMRLGLLTLGDALSQVDVELDGLRALQLLPQNYELILIDLFLQAMDGLQLLLLLKQQAPGTRFVIVGEGGNEEARVQAYQHGADFFLERPRDPAGLAPALESITTLLETTPELEASASDEEAPLLRIADVVQTRCLSGDSVLLQVQSERRHGEIFIYRGEVFHAQYPGKSGESAFCGMVLWDAGLVRIRTLKISHLPPRTIELPYRELLGRALHTPSPASFVLRPPTGELLRVSLEPPLSALEAEVIREAPPLSDDVLLEPPVLEVPPEPVPEDGTPLPVLNAHWKINLMGELVEGSQVSEMDRCALITNFIYRKLADVAVVLEVDYFNEMTLWGPHLQQVLVADNLGVRHAVFETPRTDESQREQYVKWCREQSF
jgi:CheY-like chemotaxis protein